jgi:hypothetical protein
VVNVDVRRSGPGGAVVGREPGSGRRGTGRVGHDVGAVTLEDRLAGVASSASLQLAIFPVSRKVGERGRTRSG